ncbi:MAG: hypothetical protein A2V65_09855 [Deltaproteobacteria bacterium RBG_13_49_15]|nr:MAG: hypothetical protein A2V65_09855 [Deltaproteobacteria bacterium RBG_13_49_15]
MLDYDDLHKLWYRAHTAGSPIKYIRNAIVFNELEKLLPGNTLDAGCGTGEYSIFLAKKGHKVTVFDPSPFAIKTLMESGGDELGIEAQIKTINGFRSSGKFDNIISIEIFEHLTSGQEAICKLYSFLKHDGIMILSVPAAPFLYSQSDKISGHYRRYSKKRIKDLLERVHFKKKKIIGYGFPVLFLYLLFKKIFLDKILIKHFSTPSISKEMDKRFRLLSSLYPVILSVDRLNLPFWNIGYVIKCTK